MTMKVLLADDHQMMREGLRTMLDSLPDVEVVAEAEDGQQALDLARKLQPDMVVMDVAMPKLNGMETTRRLKAELPKIKVVALSMHSDRQFVVGMLRAGASAYLLKDCAFRELATAIKDVSAGRSFLTASVADQVVEEINRPSGGGAIPTLTQLTSREREILQLIAEAKTSKEIASMLHISIKTVYTHRRNIMEKTRARNLAELTRMAIRHGITSL
jgi:two-component system, NarL family, response regulator NreC